MKALLFFKGSAFVLKRLRLECFTAIFASDRWRQLPRRRAYHHDYNRKQCVLLKCETRFAFIESGVRLKSAERARESRAGCQVPTLVRHPGGAEDESCVRWKRAFQKRRIAE